MNTLSRSVFSRSAARGALALVAGAALASCNEQKIQNGFEGDATAPLVAIVKSFGDTADVRDGLRFTVTAADNLGLKTISTAFTGGHTGQVDSTFRTAVTAISAPFTVNFPQNSTAGGWVYIRVVATDGNNNSATARDSIFLTNVDALIVTLISPATGAITSAGKSVLIEVNAHQSKGIQKVGWIAVGVVSGSDSVIYGPPLDTTVAGKTFTDTLSVPASVTSGTFTVVGFAEDAVQRRVVTVQTPVTIQSVATDNTPPIVTFSVPKRAEVSDSIFVRALDPSGITSLGWTARDRGTGAIVGGDSVTGLSGAFNDVSQTFFMNLNLLVFPRELIVDAFAVDAANNRGSGRVGLLATSAPKSDTITVVNGITRPLPQGGRIGDAVYSRNLNEIYLTNMDRNWVEVFSLTDTSFHSGPSCLGSGQYCGIPVGAQPWGIALWPRDTLGATGDSVVVANSGGTNLSVVDLVARRQIRRHALPNFLIQTIKTKVSATVPGQVNLEITEYDFSDRPEYLAMTCRPAGGTACPANAIFAVYSTLPTAGQSGGFAAHGTMRWENMNPALLSGHFFWEHAQISMSTSADTLQIVQDRGTTRFIDLSGACGVIVQLQQLAFLDTTFVRNSGNFTRALIGEGGVGDAALSFARTIGYNAQAGVIGTAPTACSGYIKSGTDSVLFAGPRNEDLGISPGIQVRDFIANTATTVKSIATNFNGLTNLIRADKVYVIDRSLRLAGILNIPGNNPGMDLNFDHRFDAICGGTAGSTGTNCGPNGLNPNERLTFAAREDANIDAMDTFFYGKVATIPIRDPVIGPLRVARLPTGEQLVVGVTARGVVTVRLPAITNVYQAKAWGAPNGP